MLDALAREETFQTTLDPEEAFDVVSSNAIFRSGNE
jgi:hypothetical protein